MKWEYSVKNIPVSEAKSVEEELKAAGKEGWELVAYIDRSQTTGSIGPPAHLFIFKRASG